MTKIFVYGTLKSGHYNHSLMKRTGAARLLDPEAFIRGRMYHLGNYPAVTMGDEPIKGELWEVDPVTLKLLDQLEGHPNFYVRSEVRLVGSLEPVQTYLLPEDRLPFCAVHMRVGNWPIQNRRR